MKGFGVLKINEVGWIEKERPVCGPLDAIVRPTTLAPCTSDVHTSHGGAGAEGKDGMILGHEAVGEVVEVGELVTRFKPGDKVVVATTTPDWMQPATQGRYHQHDTGPLHSFKYTTTKDGSFAEFFHVNHADANMALLPEGVTEDQAVMVVDMMSTGFHSVENARVTFGDTVVVIGIGPVGLMAIAGAKLAGAGRILAVGTRPNCVEIAKKYGATDIISYKKGDIVEQIAALTNGDVDSVIIAGGNKDSLAQAIAMVKAGGTVSNVNYYDVTDVLAFPAYLWGLGMKNVDIRGGFCPGGALRIEKLLKMIQYGRVDTSLLITHTFEGFEKIEDAFKLMAEKPSDLIKPVIHIKW